MMFPKPARSQPKPRKALRPCRPGKKPKPRRARSTGQATPEQLQRWELIRHIGCICCRQLRVLQIGATEIHHLTLGGLAGQKRLGHDASIGLCAWHHRAVVPAGKTLAEMEWTYDASLARGSKPFRKTFGLDSQLLAYQEELFNTPRGAGHRCAATQPTGE